MTVRTTLTCGFALVLLSGAAMPLMAQDAAGPDDFGKLAPDAQPLNFVNEGYPDWSGAWMRIGGVRHPVDPTDVPLTPEGRAVYEAGRAAQAQGLQGNDPTWNCLSPGMPRMVYGVLPIEYVVTPQVTYVLMEYQHDIRRIYTDGRDWPEVIDPTFGGYSLGTWEDTDNDDTFDTLNVETRAITGKRSYGSEGMPLSPDDDTVVFERIALNPDDPEQLDNVFTVMDGYLTEPMTATRSFTRDRLPVWAEFACMENNLMVQVNGEFYVLSEDRKILYPTRPDQPPPAFFEPR